MIPFKVKIDKFPENGKNEGKRVIPLHARIGPVQIDGLIMRLSHPSFCVE